MTKKLLSILLCSVLISKAYAESGAWIPSWTDLFWDNNANWSGASFPNGAGEVAAFIGQNPGTLPIDSSQDITISSLHFDAPDRSLSIAFTSNNLIFDTIGVQNQANIFIAKEQTHFIDTPVILEADLSIFAGTSASLYLNAPISGDHSVSLFVDPNTHINSNIGHTYTGDTIIQSGWLDINGPGSATNVPGDIIIKGSGALKHDASVSNNYGANSRMYIAGGNVDLNGTTQTISSLEMDQRGVLRGAPGSTLVLNDDLIAIKLRDESLVMVDNLVIENGGSILNDPSAPGNGYFLGFVAPQGYMAVDLNGNTVTINSEHGGYGPNFDILLDFANVRFSNGSLLKTGNGRIIFEGQGSLESLGIIDGGVQIGRPNSPATIDASGTILIESMAFLSGFGTLGNDGAAEVINGGYLIPGDHAEQGGLTISGDFEQLLGGRLLIQGMSESNVNTLQVAGDAVLNGMISFSALPGANFNPGDEVVLIDAEGSLSGSFFGFQANLPEGLSASLSYTSTQVIMNITACE